MSHANDDAPSGRGARRSSAAAIENPGFVTKLFEIFSDTSRRPGICGWARDGTTIIVQRISEFERTVLPLYFKHNNYTSFVRQLNM